MSEKIDRRIGSNGFLIVAAVIIFILAVAAGSYLLLRMERAPLPPGLTSLPQQRPDDSLMITLFMPADDALSAGPVAVKRQPDTQAQAREALIAALSDVRAAQSPVLKDLKLKELFLDAFGTAYIDLTLIPEGGIRASAADELLALCALVNVLTVNFEEIKQVRFLVDGKEAASLAGHMDLSGALRKRTDLVE
jgi:hypothetical protein